MFKKFNEILENTVKERRLRNINNIAKYGIQVLDDYLGGILENELVVIGAGSGVGKTELAIQIAIENALNGKKVALFSLEGDIGEVVYRYLQKLINLEMEKEGKFVKPIEYRLNLRNVDIYENRAIKELNQKISDNLFIYDKSEAIPNQDKLIEVFEKSYNKFDMFILDHLHYLDFGNEERQGISNMIQAIKTTTEIMKKPVVVISHLGRRHIAEKRDPDKTDLFGSSNIEKNANTIILLNPTDKEDFIEDKIYDEDYLRGTKIIIDKSRSGLPVPAKFKTVFNLKTKEYQTGDKFNIISPEKNNRISEFDRLVKTL